MTSQDTSQPASAVIYYMPDGYSMSGRRLMGRQSAGASFLAGYARHATVRDFVCMAPDRKAAEAFAETVQPVANEAGRPLRSARWIPFETPERIGATGCLFYPSPTIADHAWLRRRHDQRAWSLCGITHTTASDTVMEAIGTFATAPLQSWDAVICTSRAVHDMVEGLLDRWHEYLGARLNTRPEHPARLQLPIIPLGIDAQAFAGDDEARITFRQQNKISSDSVAALFLGRLSATAKAHPLPMFMGLQAAQRATGRRVHLILAGWFESEAERKQIEGLAREVCPDVPVHIVDGRDAEIRRQAWSAADFFTSLSDNIQETFGLTPVEAMAAGLPVVITDWNGYRDTLDNGVQGIAVPTVSAPPGAGDILAARYRSGRYSYGGYIGRAAQFTAVDPDLVADAYTRLISDDDLRKHMGKAGQAHARSRFDWSVIIPEYEALWTELAARRATDTEIAPVAPGASMDLLRDDPYRLFEGYPSDLIDMQMTVRRRTTDAAMDNLLRFEINSAVSGLLPEAAQTRALLAALPDGGAPVSVGELIAAAGAEPVAALRAILWFAKLGAVKLSRP